MTNPRKSDHEIDQLFLDRWSARSFVEAPMPETELLQLFEAARWAPSSFNYQPWRFLYAMRDTPEWKTFFGLLVEINQSWAFRASALVFVLSDTRVMRPNSDKPIDSYTHIFDTGMAYGQMALQATSMGLFTHPMQAFDRVRAHAELKVPDFLRFACAVAVGRKGHPDQLSDYMKGREAPNGRRPMNSMIATGEMPESWVTPAAP